MRRVGSASARHRAEHLATRAVGAVARALPEVAADRLGAILGWLLARVWRPRWKVVTAQLRTAFPDADERWRLRVARRSYTHFGAEMVAWLRLGGARRAAIRERTRLIGGEILAEARERGRGVMLVSGHLGNWEVGTAGIVARGFAVDVVVARQRNPLFDSYLTGARERLGMRVVLREDARAGVADALEAGRFVGIMGDQDARSAGVFVDFFGRPASTARGPALLALRSGALLATFHTVRRPGWRPRYDVHIAPVRLKAASELSSRRARVAALTQAIAGALEGAVRTHPEQYLWHHRRWKTKSRAEQHASSGQRSAGKRSHPR